MEGCVGDEVRGVCDSTLKGRGRVVAVVTAESPACTINRTLPVPLFHVFEG